MNQLMVRRGWGALLAVALMTATCRANDTGGALTGARVSEPTIRWHDEMESGWRESRRRNVPMVIFITSDHCSYCDLMKQNTWCDKSIRRRIASEFVAIRLNPRRNAKTLGRIDVQMFPTTLIGAPRGKVIGKRFGYQPPAAVHGLLSEVESALPQQ